MYLHDAMLARGRENNFNTLRLAAALAVLVSHSYALSTGNPGAEPLRGNLNIALGSLAVAVFFFISGFLVSMSLESRASLTRFAVARIFRIYPGLLVAVTATVFVVGPLLSPLNFSDYISDKSVKMYLIFNAFMVFGVRHKFADIFESNPYPGTVNGSLWSISYELAMYAGLAFLWLLLRRWPKALRFVSLSIAVFGLIIYCGHFNMGPEHAPSAKFVWLIPMFFLGVSANLFRHKLPLSYSGFVMAVAVLCVAAFSGSVSFRTVYPVCIGYLVLFLAYAAPLLRSALNADWSYGLYIYAFLVQQIIISAVPGMSPSWLTITAIAVVVPLAALSWRWVEQPCLARVDLVSDRISRAVIGWRT